MSGVSIGALLGTGAVLLIMGGALGGCNARTELADVTDGGESGTSSEQSGGSTSGGRPSNQGGSATGGSAAGEPSGGGSAGTGSGATGGTGSATGGTGSGATGGTGDGGGTPAGGGGGTGGQCWDPTVDAYCHFFPCPPRGAGSPELIVDFFESTGTCDNVPVLVDYDTCGAEIWRADTGFGSQSYMYISGTLGAAAISSDAQFGPCDAFSYYAGIELDEFYEEYGCSVVNRCVACGPVQPDDPQYPPCRTDCQCVDVVIGTDPCFDPTSCECYCAQGLPKDD